jgi:hypothetical protein
MERFQADGWRERRDKIPIEVKKIEISTSIRLIPRSLRFDLIISHPSKIDVDPSLRPKP